MYVFLYVCTYVCYIWIYIVCMLGFYSIHTYESGALAQGTLKSFFAFINFLMPVAPNRPRLSGKHGMHSPNSLAVCHCKLNKK